MPAAKKPAPKRKSTTAAKRPPAKKPAAKRVSAASSKKAATTKPAKRPAAKRKQSVTKTQRQSLAKLATRAKQAGDAATLLDSQFSLAYGLADAIDDQIRRGAIPFAAHYRELRMLLSDIVGIIQQRERADAGGDAYSKLSELLSKTETNDSK